jgi:hypothetical protein
MGLGMVIRMQRSDKLRLLGQLSVAREGASVKKVVQELWETARKSVVVAENTWSNPVILD